MKDPQEYIINQLKKDGFRTGYIAMDSTIIALKQAQIDAYNEALEDASENATAKEDPADYGTGGIWVDPDSILNLKKS